MQPERLQTDDGKMKLIIDQHVTEKSKNTDRDAGDELRMHQIGKFLELDWRITQGQKQSEKALPEYQRQ